MPAKKENTEPGNDEKKPIREDKKNKADLEKNRYPLPDIKDTQYNYQPEFIDNSGNKKEKD